MALLTLTGVGLRLALGGSHVVFVGTPLWVACFLLASRAGRRWGTPAGTAVLCVPLYLVPLHVGIVQGSGAGTPSLILLVFGPLLATHIGGVRAGGIAAFSVVVVLVLLLLVPIQETDLDPAVANRLRVLFIAISGAVGWLAIARSRQQRDQALQDAMRERRVAEAANAEVEALLDHAPANIVIKDRNGRYLRANRAFRETVAHWLGKPVELVGRSQAELDPQSAVVMGPRDDKLWATGQAQVFEDTFSTADGEQTLLVTLFPIRDGAGDMVSLGAIAQDISERVRMERELLMAKQELERSNSELQHFAAVVAHDLKSPARTAALLAEMLEEDLEDQLGNEEAKALHRLIATTQHMTTLVDRVLAYSSVGQSPLRLERVAVDALVREVLDSHGESELAAEQLQLRCSGFELVADRAQLRQVLDNLIGNAIKYRSLERPLSITVEALERAGAWELLVRDNGVGIVAEGLDKIFQPFTRLDATRDREGCGIGLATCARVADRHGGRLWAESEPGQGTTFHLELPKRPAPEEKDSVDRDNHAAA